MTPYESTHITHLASIDASLKTIAAYAAYLHQQATGLREVRVTAYVRAHNAGGDLVHLYTDHPKVGKRVGRVYFEHFAALPFDPHQGKLHDGEQAPSRDWAAANGYLNPVAPFTAIFAPTGKTTDTGKAIYRFARVVSVPQPSPVQVPSIHPTDPSTPPTAPSQALSSAPSPHTGDPLACPTCGKDWRHYNSACADHRNPKSPPTPSAHPGNLPARITRTSPLSPDHLRRWIQQSTDDNTTRNRSATKSQTGAVHQSLVKLIADEATRRHFQEWLIGHPSMSEWSPVQILAVHAWLKPSAGNGPTDPFAAEEVAQALAFLRSTPLTPTSSTTHPAWTTTQDATDWAFRQGAFPDPATAQDAFTALWKQLNRPALETMFIRWETHVTNPTS